MNINQLVSNQVVLSGSAKSNAITATLTLTPSQAKAIQAALDEGKKITIAITE